jgi:hypothetical protein
MKTPTEIQESGHAGQPGEPTAEKRSDTLTASGVASLLASEFASADETPEEPDGQGNPPPKTSDVAGEKPVTELPADDAPSDAAGDNDAEDAPKTPEETPAAEDALPAEMQDALTQWEAKGGPLPDALQKVVNKRIGRLTGERDEAQGKLASAEAAQAKLTAEISALRSDPARAATPASPGLDETTLAKMDTASAAFINEAENFLDGAATPEEQARIEKYMASERLDERGLKRRLREVNEFRTQQLPQQRQALQQFRALESQAEPQAKKYFGKLDDKASPEFAEAEAVMRLIPELRTRTPAHKIAQGTYVLGLKALRILQDAGVEADAFGSVETALLKAFPAKGSAPKPTAAKTPPPKAPAGSAAPVRTAKATPQDAARAQFSKTPTRETATELARAALMEA